MMIHLPALIVDLGVILITAAVVTLVFRFLKQPVVLGYIIAGFLVGHHVPYLPTVTEVKSIQIWAEIGVIFLLFGLGLEFSFKKLVKVGKSAALTASIEVFFMLGLGFFAGQIFGWSTMDSLFLGGILSISSTAILVRAFDELGLKTKKFVSLVFGILIFEDLFAVLLMVLLSTVAVTKTLAGGELLVSSLRLGFFLVVWFLVGIYILPYILKKIRPLLTNETTLIVSIGLCLMMVLITTTVGFSPALGAFVIGSILAETKEGHRIEHLFIPVRDLFAAIFFVSVGMMIDPTVLMEHWEVILIATGLVISGKFLGASLGALLSGQSIRTSVQTGMSITQIGEFSFIIATLGLTLNVISDFLYPVAVAVSSITAFTTPYMIKLSGPFSQWIEKNVPNTISNRLETYQSTVQTTGGEGLFLFLWRAHGLRHSLNFVVIIAITLGMHQFVMPYAVTQFGESIGLSFLLCLLNLMLCSPFLWPIVFSGPAASIAANPESMKKLKDLQLGTTIFRSFLAVLLTGFIVSQYSSILAVSGLILLSLALTVTFLSRFAEPFYVFIEKHFLASFNDREHAENTGKKPKPKLAPWDALLAEVVVSPDSKVVMKSLQNSTVKERHGIIISLIERGHKRILAPTRDDVLLPGDRLFVIGTDDQIESARREIETITHLPETDETESYGLSSLILSSQSTFVGKTIRNCGLREAIHGIIVGIERAGERILNPDSAIELKAEDLIWIVGDLRLIRQLVSKEN